MKLLVLLIGHNNIANYSLIKFLKRKGFLFDKIGVIYTKDTKSNMLILQNLLQEKFIDIDVEDVKENFLEIEKRIFNILNNIENLTQIFLDYTGGLKSMSLGAYLGIEKTNIDEKNKYFSYVYFDRKENKSKVVFKRGDSYELNENLTIKEIANIHNIFDLFYKQKNSKFFSLESVKFLFDKIGNSEQEFFIDLWDKKDIKNLPWKDSLKNYPYNISTISHSELKKLQKYIRGDFLEEYIFYLLKEIQNEVGIYEVAWNVTQGKSGEFEVDIVASKNNSLYLFSCTTDRKKDRAKTKGFEAKERVTQMGGKNAKAILVSCVSQTQKESLNKDLEEKKGGVTPEIITYEDLLNKDILKEKLKQIFK